MGKRKNTHRGKSKQKPTPKSKQACGPRVDHVAKKAGWAGRPALSQKVIAAIQWLLPFVMMGLVLLSVCYTLLDPIPLCWAAKKVGGVAQAMLSFATLPQMAPWALLATAILAALAEAVTILTKMLLYNGVPIFFAYMFFGPMKSSVFWKFLHHLPEVLGLHTEIAKSFMTCWAFIGVMVVWEDTFESVKESHLITKLVKTVADNLAQAIMLVLKVGLYTSVPLFAVLVTLAAFYVLGSQAGVWGAVGPWVAGVGVGSLLAVTLTIAGISALLVEGHYLRKAKPPCAPKSNAEEPTTDTDISKTLTLAQATNDKGSSTSPPKHAAKHDKNITSGVINDAPAGTIMAAYGSNQQDSKNVSRPDVSQAQTVALNDQAVGSHDQAVGSHDQAVGINDQAAGSNTQAVGVNDQAVGINAHAVGSHDQAVGTHARSKSKKKNKKTKKSADAQLKKAGTSTTNADTPNSDGKTAPVTNAEGSRLAPASHPSSASKTTVAGNDAYSTLVKALLNQAVDAPPAVHAEIMKSMSRLYRTVPKWMLNFGAAYNGPGCSACDGLEAFKLCFQKHHLKDPSTSAFRSMVLLLRTFVAAIVEEELGHVSYRDHLMAKDILRLAPEAGMPDYLREVPQWQLTALQQRLCL